jgi:hypothetical protein
MHPYMLERLALAHTQQGEREASGTRKASRRPLSHLECQRVEREERRREALREPAPIASE